MIADAPGVDMTEKEIELDVRMKAIRTIRARLMNDPLYWRVLKAELDRIERAIFYLFEIETEDGD